MSEPPLPTKARRRSVRGRAVVVCACSWAACAARADDPPHLSAHPAAVAVRRLIAHELLRVPNEVRIGLLVHGLEDGSTWASHSADLPLKPASVMKLFVTAAALDRFGADFEFTTRLYLLDRELLVLGAGDPGLGDERIAKRHGRELHGEFDAWADGLRQAGVESLRTIAIDDGIFDRQFRHPDWPDDQAQTWYQAPVGGVNFNDNCLEARIEYDDGAIRLLLRPELPPSFYVDRLAPGKRPTPTVTRSIGSDVFEFRGSVARHATLAPVSVRRPAVFFGHALRQALVRRGIDVSENVVRRAFTPEMLDRARPLAVHSTSLRDVLWRADNFSQNLFAECLLKALPAYAPDGSRSGRPGTWPAGGRVLAETLKTIGVQTQGAVFRDGSGLSHDNRVTAAQVVDLLAKMTRHRHADVFLESLARPGQEGSMRTRYNDPALVGRLRGKTGTIRDVRALAGVLRRDDGATLVFALLINGDASPGLPLRVCRALLAAPGTGR